ncbi:hypothetical protein HPB50_009341 [Hyalomma asiaticum]|uniref:Uncharacterized protein n=1 Tax=Hyalomma asiaticum TaxID=266040 RepID=A0ACB7T435_HYAAI|nr:hypothetical protein HPB50_009341 [Hyalomma asiaticum]
MFMGLTLMDVSNYQQHVNQNHRGTKEFSDPEDSRHDWPEAVFLEHVENLASCEPHNSLTKAAHHVLVFTTVSTVQRIRFLLNKGFKFVPARTFSIATPSNRSLDPSIQCRLQ